MYIHTCSRPADKWFSLRVCVCVSVAAHSLPAGHWQQCGLASRACDNVLLLGEGGKTARAAEQTRQNKVGTTAVLDCVVYKNPLVDGLTVTLTVNHKSCCPFSSQSPQEGSIMGSS